MTTTGDQVLDALHAYKLKQEKPNEWRCNSPLRPGSNSHAFTVTIAPDGEHGSFYDHVSEESGSLYTLAKHLGIKLPDQTPVQDTKRAYEDINDYAAAHGITGDALVAAGWTEVKKDSRPALAFKTQTGIRYRFLDGNKPSYKSPANYKRCWYGLNTQTFQRVAAGEPLVICNGEISTVVAHDRGLAACAITGGEHEIPPDLFQELTTAINPTTKIIVALDCDDKGRATALKMKEQLQTAGFQVRAVNLGLGKGGDLADFCMLHDQQVLSALEQLAELQPVEARAHRWQIIHAADLKNMPTVSWLVPGEIPEFGLTMLVGTSGVGKSFVALDYALNIAQHEPVVYIAAEGQAGYRKRVAAWCKHYKKTEGKLYFCMGAVSMFDQNDLQMFLNEIRPLKPKLVIVDTVARSMIGGDENNTRDMGLFVNACESLQHELTCSVLVIHHVGKNGVERGNSSLRAACDTIIRLNKDDDLIVVESDKTKDEIPFPTRYLKMLPVLIDDDNSSVVMIKADKVKQGKDDPLTSNQEKVLLTLSEFITGATPTDISEITRIERGPVSKILSRLVKRGYASQESYREPYVITPEGQLALENKLSDSTRFQSDSIPDSSKDSDQQDVIPRFHQNDHRHHIDQDDLFSTDIEESGNQEADSYDDDDVIPVKSNNGIRDRNQESGVSGFRFGNPAPKQKQCPNCKTKDSWVLHKGQWVCAVCLERRANDNPIFYRKV